jgi:prophage maintenance system killer protein
VREPIWLDRVDCLAIHEFMLAATFLDLNGLEFTATEEEVCQQTLAFAAKEIDEGAYVNWLSRNASTRKRRKR